MSMHIPAVLHYSLADVLGNSCHAQSGAQWLLQL